MSRLSLVVLSLVFAAPLAAEAPPSTVPPAPTKMQSLFNGKDLTGWDGDPRLWSVRQGVIRGETTPDRVAQGNTFLIWTGGRMTDFDLRLSFRCNAVNNSGIQYRSERVVGDAVRNDWVVRGYQFEGRNEIKFPNVAGFIYDERGKRGRICLVGEVATWEPEGKRVIRDDLIDEAEFAKLFRLDDWNEVAIIARGNRISHYINGRLILDFTDNEPNLRFLEGVLALQLHAGKPMWAEFKDIRLGELSE